ncbi:MAG: fumarylacetoacetate hydrolase family protein [Firmicutes bacterium]|nr:fumarylacetoacetate hydrolase family protein [Bacillota bacterium]
MPTKYVRFSLDGSTYYGQLQGDRVVLIQGDIFSDYQLTDRVVSLNSVELLTPCQPSSIVCVGLNYRKHALEMGLQLPSEPIIFLKPHTSLLPHQGDIVYWPPVGRLDYEAELAIVIGKRCHRVCEEDAMQYVFGYTIANDVTARDLQSKDGQWTRAKSFNTFCPLGPSIVTDIDANNLRLKAILNGQVKQDGTTADLIFNIPQLVSFVSQVLTLHPGDVILTGTPSGVGPMQVGDEIRIEIEGLGSLTNRVVAP